MYSVELVESDQLVVVTIQKFPMEILMTMKPKIKTLCFISNMRLSRFQILKK